MLGINKTAYLFILWKINVTQLIDQNNENFHVRALNGRRLSFKSPLESLKSVISLISLKSGDFIILVHQTV